MASDPPSSQDPKSDGLEPERRRTRNARRKSGMGFAAAASGLLVILFGSFYVLVIGTGGRANSAEFALVIDAGSSGSRIHLYQWQHDDDDDRLPVITEIALDGDCEKVHRGLSKLGGNDDTDETASRVHDSLALLITCAKLGLIDRAREFQKVPLYLRATAGMRILRSDNKDVYDKILAEVLAYLSNTPFDLRGARVIEGQEEALYAWIAANYLNGSLGKAGKDKTIGILELGGASGQIAFAPEGQNLEKTELVQIGGRKHRVYMRGYDGVGKDEIFKKFRGTLSCYPKDYEIKNSDVEIKNANMVAKQKGTGNYGDCQEAIRNRLPGLINDMGLSKETSLPDHDDGYWALSNFYHTPKFLKSFKKENPDLFKQDDPETSELESVGPEYCGKEWNKIDKDNPTVPDDFLTGHCFMAAYIPILLTEVFGEKITKGRVMLLPKADVDWTLGALICSLYDCRSES